MMYGVIEIRMRRGHLIFISSNLVHLGPLESVDFGGIFGGILKNRI